MIHFNDVKAGSTVYIPFGSYGADGESITLSGLALADIKVYKNGSVTKRSSTSGFTLLDTDGIDFDGITGIHGISIDLSDDTDSGFFAAGAFYWVVIDNVTINAQTVSFVAATFNIRAQSIDDISTVVPDAAGTAPTAVEIRQEMDSNSTQLAAAAAAPTAVAIRQEMDSNSTQLAAAIAAISGVQAEVDNIDGEAMRGTDNVVSGGSAPSGNII